MSCKKRAEPRHHPAQVRFDQDCAEDAGDHSRVRGWTIGVGWHILGPMLRQLLTLLAILAGFAAVAEPVHAARAGAAVESVGQVEQAAPCRKARIVLQLDEEPRKARAARERDCPGPRAGVIVPSVQLKADRARE